MEYFEITLIITLVCACASEGGKVELNAVSNFGIAEDLYRRIKNQHPNTETPSALDAGSKKQICHEITRSGYFSSVLGEKLIHAHQLYDKLKDKHADILLKLYELAANETPGDDLHLVHANRTKPVDVEITGNADYHYKIYQENAFACLILDAEDRLGIRLVSEEYNFSDTPDSQIPGRFIVYNYRDEESDGEDDDEDEDEDDYDDYEDDDDEDETCLLHVYAVAEAPAKSLLARGAAVEREYLVKKAGNLPEEERSNDPICKLKMKERLRVCTLVLSATYFEDGLVFKPEYSYIDETECFKREISFEDEQVKLKANGKRYEEWMISCRLEKHAAGFRGEYFLSRVYNSNSEVFVYKVGKNSEIVLENLFGDVRFKI